MDPTKASISPLADHPQFLPMLVGWIQKQWPDPDRKGGAAGIALKLYDKASPRGLPLTLMVMKDKYPVGFVSLIHYEIPARKGLAHWVNALYVDMPFRRSGLASRLLGEVEKKAASLGLKELHAYTDQTSLYLRAGWKLMPGSEEMEKGEVIMHKVL